MKTFIDTGGWIAVVVEVDRYHDLATLHFNELLSRHEKLFTSDFVLDEAVTRILYDVDHSTAVTFLDLIREAQCQGSLQVLYVDEAVWRAAENLFRRYHDQGFSFTDCTSIILAQQAKADEIFGFDRHFLVVGFNVKPLW